MTALLGKAEHIGPQALTWAQEVIAERGVRAYRLLQGLISLTRSHPRERVDWVLLTVRMFEVSPRASLTHAFADLHCVFGLICRLVRAAIPSECQSGCVA